MATPKEKYYNALLDTLVKDNNLRGEPLSNEKIQKAVGKVIEETEAEFERNYNEIICDNSYQSPILKKDVLIINDSVYYESDEHVDMISDSRKQFGASNEPIKDTHIVDRINNLSVGIISVDQAVIGVRIIVKASTKALLTGAQTLAATSSLTF